MNASADTDMEVLPEESPAWKEVYFHPKAVARRMKKHHRKMQRMGLFSWPRQTHILDLCCGTGEALRILRNAGFTRLSGLDVTIDPELKHENWLDIKAGDSRALHYPDASFDAIVCMHSLHHLGGVEGIRAALGEAWRVLKPGGRVALTDHYDSLQLRFAFWACRQSWLTWPSFGLRAFKRQLDEEWPYLSEYIDAWPQVQAVMNGLGPMRIELDAKGPFFFYWTAVKK